MESVGNDLGSLQATIAGNPLADRIEKNKMKARDDVQSIATAETPASKIKISVNDKPAEQAKAPDKAPSEDLEQQVALRAKKAKFLKESVVEDKTADIATGNKSNSAEEFLRATKARSQVEGSFVNTSV